MWVVITLSVIVVAITVGAVFIILPMCKEYDEIYFEEMNKNDVVAASSELTEDNGGDSALIIEKNIDIKE